ncbi:hypothetical protein FOA52_001494 [Chlamydomonas sp. UWO 241]|nr:hypothetical protein FOA52_001494 [Chlamydomonas sp. UWO 241]
MAAAGPERWSRGCGSGGIGPAGSLPSYRFGVLEANWGEETSGKELSQTGRNVFNQGASMRGASTTQETYTPEGKSGVSLIAISERKDHELGVAGQGRDVLMRHGDFLKPPIDTATSLNSLTYSAKQLGEPGVQAYLWSGSNHGDAMVPTKASELSLTKTKVAQWVEQADPYAGFTSTQRASQLAAATAAASSPKPIKQGAIVRPVADGGQPAQIGRKPVGPMVAECEKNYRNIGLRDTYCTFLTARKQ